MRVGVLSQWFPPETGPASIPGVLGRGLVELGHQVVVLTGYPNYPTGLLYDGFTMKLRENRHEHGYLIRRVALYPDHSNQRSGRILNYGSFALSAAAFGISALKGVDVLWVYNSPATVALPMWLAKKRFHVPVVLHNMDMWPDSVIQAGFTPRRGAGLAIAGLHAWVNEMYRSAAIVAYLTPSAGEELERRGVSKTKLRYAPVWVDEDVYKPTDGARLRRDLGFTDEDIVVGYAGALGQAQGVSELAKAVVSLPDGSPIKCLVIGSGTQAENLASIARDHPRRIRFMGQIPHHRMGEFSAVPDVSFVGLSENGHAAFASPSKVSAIMACAKPLIAAVGGDTADLVRRSGSGIVVTPGDTSALIAALSVSAQQGRSGLSQQGRVARRFYDENLSMHARIRGVERLLVEAVSAKRPR